MTHAAEIEVLQQEIDALVKDYSPEALPSSVAKRYKEVVGRLEILYCLVAYAGVE